MKTEIQILEPAACIVFDGRGDVKIPPEMGRPRANQMKGGTGSQVSELAGRVCYDSLGHGRSSDEYHAHILKVGHLSVYEHWNACVLVDLPIGRVRAQLGNRPGFWADSAPGDVSKTILSLNMRALLDWLKWGNTYSELYYALVHQFSGFLNLHSPMNPAFSVDLVNRIENYSDEHAWVTVWIQCSRACSHELVRHGDRTAISQRSTRYVDESSTGIIRHPLWPALYVEEMLELHTRAIELYKRLERFGNWDKKVRRGLARMCLPHWTATQIIFSASVAQWRRMIEMRMTNAADAEIRVLFNRLHAQLKFTQYAHRFVYATVDAEDGAGVVIE